MVVHVFDVDRSNDSTTWVRERYKHVSITKTTEKEEVFLSIVVLV